MRKKKPADPTAAIRKQRERERKAEFGLVRRDVWAHEENWPKIRALERKLIKAREGKEKK